MDSMQHCEDFDILDFKSALLDKNIEHSKTMCNIFSAFTYSKRFLQVDR